MRVLILADVHSNYPALTAVLESAPEVDEVFCLGDIVLYGPNPVATVDLIRERATKVVRGNHDEETVRCYRRSGDQEKGDTDGLRWKQWTVAQLRDDQIEYLAGLPEEIELEMDGYRVLLRHDLPLPGPLIYADDPDELIVSRLDTRPFDYMFVGHVHIPYVRTLGTRRLIDVGSVGQPEHGDGCAAYALWTEGEVTFHKAPYDVERAIADLEKLPLSSPYIELWSEFWRGGFVDRPALGELEKKLAGSE